MRTGDTLTIAAGHYHVHHRLAAFVAREEGYWTKEGLPDVAIVATGKDELTLAGLER